VLCPQCLTYMRLAKIEPDPNNAQITMMSFDCACGFVYQQSERTTEDDEAA